MEDSLNKREVPDEVITINQEKKPKCKLTGTDGNVFALAGIVGEVLRKAGLAEKAKEFSSKLFQCHSYDEALCLISDYVDVE